MFNRVTIRRAAKVEGESPFWISFSDLMSALMVLFLLVMAVTLVSVTKDVTTAEARKIQREKDIKQLMSSIHNASAQFPEVRVEDATFRIDLGEVVRFDSGRSDISPSGAQFLRSYVPVILAVEATPLGHQWIRRVVVEGFTDQDGSYLYNLGLSLDRSRKVVCVLFAPQQASEAILTQEQKTQIRDLFLVGGYSFNSMKASKEASRRVELRIDFWALDEEHEAHPDLSGKDFGQC